MKHARIGVLGALVMAISAVACGGPNASTSNPTMANATPGTSAMPTPTATAARPSSSALPTGGTLALVPGTHVSMITPVGFTASTSFTGFEHECGASIVVAELPGAYGSLVIELTDAALASQGITVESRTDATIDGRPGVMILGTQKASGLSFVKVLVITGTESLTAFLTGNSPTTASCRSEVLLAMRDAELGMKFDPDAAVDQEAGLFYTLRPIPPLKFAGALTGGGIYNTSGRLPAADKDEPTLTVSSSLGAPAGADLEATLKAAVDGMATMSDVAIESSEAGTIAGLPGAIVIATGTRSSTSTPVFIYAGIIDEGSLGYVLLLGTAKADARAEWQAPFAATMSTYQRK